MLSSDHVCISEDVDDLIKLVEDQPTAYNPDKVVENATNVCNINPETPLENVVADCMTDYLEMRKAKDEGLLLRLPCKVGGKVYVIAPNYNKCENHYECEEYDSEQYLITWCQANCPKGFKGIGVVETKVVEIKIREGDIYLQTDRCGLRNTKNMFLTKEEAEQALKQMKGE